MKRKLVCLLLAVVMLSAMAVTAFAVDTSSWPTEIHANCPHSSATKHFYATGNTFSYMGFATIVEGRVFNAGGYVDAVDSGAYMFNNESSFGPSTFKNLAAGWFYWNGSKFVPCTDHSWERSADGHTTSCTVCDAYVTVTATSGTVPQMLVECFTISTNLPAAPSFLVYDTSVSPAAQVAPITSAEGNYQVIAQVEPDKNPYANFTLTNPKTTASTGDNRPIELLFVGFIAMSAMAAAAFTMDRKRR